MNVHRSESVSLKEETAAAAAKSAFPVTVTGGLFLGYNVSDLVQLATLVFLVLQIGLLIPRYLSIIKEKLCRK